MIVFCSVNNITLKILAEAPIVIIKPLNIKRNFYIHVYITKIVQSVYISFCYTKTMLGIANMITDR